MTLLARRPAFTSQSSGSPSWNGVTEILTNGPCGLDPIDQQHSKATGMRNILN